MPFDLLVNLFMKQNLQSLKKQFGHHTHVRFEAADNGLMLMHLEQPLATATISLYGGQILAWHPRSERSPVLWRTESSQFVKGRAIRAGVPICWPWFGPHPTLTAAPSHGYARISDWALTELSITPRGETEVCMTMCTIPESLRHHEVSALLTIRISVGETLSIALSTTNTQAQPITLTEALHAYFYVSDIREVEISGLHACDYVDLIDRHKLKSQSGAVTFTGETGRVYLNTLNDCLIVDRGLGRSILIEKSESQSTVVWNPWATTAAKMDDLGPTGWQTMVCVESANALSNAVMLGAGDTHTLSVKYSVQAVNV